MLKHYQPFNYGGAGTSPFLTCKPQKLRGFKLQLPEICTLPRNPLVRLALIRHYPAVHEFICFLETGQRRHTVLISATHRTCFSPETRISLQIFSLSKSLKLLLPLGRFPPIFYTC